MSENTREQETESRPEDAQASEQVKDVIGTLSGLKLIIPECIDIETGQKQFINKAVELGWPMPDKMFMFALKDGKHRHFCLANETEKSIHATLIDKSYEAWPEPEILWLDYLELTA